MDATIQRFYVNLPNTEVKFFKEFIQKMGWTISNAPIQTIVEEEEINEEIPADIMSLVGIASSIKMEDVDTDYRLSYLLRK